MKNYLITGILFLGFSLGLSAQDMREPLADEAVKVYKHRVGFSSIDILREIAGEATRENTYLLTYMYDMGKLHLRMGATPQFAFREISHEGFQDKQDSLFFSINVRLGLGFELLQNDKWMLDAGVDLIGQYEITELTDDSGFDVVKNQYTIQGAGLGPFFSAHYYLSPRVSLGVEAAAYGFYSEAKRTILFENFPDFNDELDHVKDVSLRVNTPSTIFIQFHF